MYDLAEDDVLKVRWRWSCLGINAYVVRHYVARLIVGTVTNEDAALAIDFNVTAQITGTMILDTVKYGLGLQRIYPGSVETEYFSDSSLSVGIIEPPALPPQCAAVIRLDPDYRGLRYRGRVFLPFQPASGLSPDGTWNVDHSALLQFAADILATPINTFIFTGSATLVPCIYHRDTHNVTTFQRAYPRPYVGTQRRRGHAWVPATPNSWT
jgi:hypothetical protein